MSAIDIVVDKITEQLEKGTVPWKQPWFSCEKQNLVTRKPYKGINRLLLAIDDEQFYLTFNQLKKLGGSVKKGAKSRMVIFWMLKSYNKDLGNGETELTQIPFMRFYNMFKASDCAGIKVPKIENKIGTIKEADKFVKNTGAPIDYSGDKAFYSPSEDSITLPVRKSFKNSGGLYSVLFHELTHWSGGKDRLNRIDFKTWGDGKYGLEELVAEIGASVLSGRFGVNDEKNSAAYCKSWLRAIKEKKTILISAAGRAEKAVSFLDGLQEKDTGD